MRGSKRMHEGTAAAPAVSAMTATFAGMGPGSTSRALLLLSRVPRRGEYVSGGAWPGDKPLDPGAWPEGSPLLSWRRMFHGKEQQLDLLRAWLASLLPQPGPRDDVLCVATELGSNALRHTASGQGGSFAVEIAWYCQAVRVLVADSGGPGEPRIIDAPAAGHGRGLLIVQSLSLRTGVLGNHRGRVVWADVPWPDSGAADSALQVPARLAGA
jgi:hypothetical protein